MESPVQARHSVYGPTRQRAVANPAAFVSASLGIAALVFALLVATVADAGSESAGPAMLLPSPVAPDCVSAGGRVLHVGPGGEFAKPSAAAAVAQDGDLVKIEAGDYRGDVATWSANGLTICGVGGRARLFADGKAAAGKAIWVMVGQDVTVQNVEFHGARVPDRNGAGIRAEHRGEMLVRDCGFYDNENGILGGSGDATMTIERSEFARNGHGDGYSHNVYVTKLSRLTVRSSVFREARVGHNLKSRASQTLVEHSYFLDGRSGTSSYLADFPNGGRVSLVGNLFHKGPRAENPNAIAYGAEGLSWPKNTFVMSHNSVVVDLPQGAFLSIAKGVDSATLVANLFAGNSRTQLLADPAARARVTETGSAVLEAKAMPGASDLRRPNFWPTSRLPPLVARVGDPVNVYMRDSPAPFLLRDVSAEERVAGALQSAP